METNIRYKVDESSILKALAEARIFSVEQDGDKFFIMEECDQSFGCTLSREEMLKLASEIYALASTQPTEIGLEPPKNSV